MSIKMRLLLSYLVVIFLSVFILDCVILISVKNYYLDNIQDILTKQAEVSSNLFEKYFNTDDLSSDAQSLTETFTSSTNAQVQILNTYSVVLSDSIGGSENTQIDYPDARKALKGSLGEWSGKSTETGEPIMSVSYPLRNNNKIIGAVRLVTSLTDVNKTINRGIIIVVIISTIILAFLAFISKLLSLTIINPVQNITEAAESMAKGNFNIKIKKQYNDEIGKLSDTLNYMQEEILKNDNLKNEFIASISHELRTPLTSINGWAITLARDDMKDNSKIRYGLKMIEQESLRLTSLVEELLDFSRLASGKIALREEYIDINELINYVINQMLPRAQRQGISINSSLAPDIDLMYVDPNRIKQVLINILDNSIKFTPKDGHINITSSVLNKQLSIEIQDTGCGIDRKSIDKVKNKFFKGNSKSPGSGIGLAVCDDIINLHHGKLLIQSEENKGTKVSIILPL